MTVSRRRRRRCQVADGDAEEHVGSELDLSPSRGFLLTPLSSPLSPIASTDSEVSFFSVTEYWYYRVEVTSVRSCSVEKG